jgi:hypothetical protein
LALEGLAAGKHIELRFEGRRTDRYGRLLAQVFAEERGKRLWLQQAMLAKGIACFYSFPDHRGCARALLAAEGEARTKRLGVWGSPAYRIVEASDLDRLDRLMHSFQLVEGKVMAVGEGAGRLYLNFAEDWRSDFTVSIVRARTSKLFPPPESISRRSPART